MSKHYPLGYQRDYLRGIEIHTVMKTPIHVGEFCTIMKLSIYVGEFYTIMKATISTVCFYCERATFSYYIIISRARAPVKQ